jgi:PilZ domain-containing protein
MLFYKVLDRTGTIEGRGFTRNLSSGGVAFEAAERVTPGAHVQLAIQWPATIRGSVAMNLIVRGYVAWTAEGLVGIRVANSRFERRPMAAASRGGYELP